MDLFAHARPLLQSFYQNGLSAAGLHPLRRLIWLAMNDPAFVLTIVCFSTSIASPTTQSIGTFLAIHPNGMPQRPVQTTQETLRKEESFWAKEPTPTGRRKLDFDGVVE